MILCVPSTVGLEPHSKVALLAGPKNPAYANILQFTVYVKGARPPTSNQELLLKNVFLPLMF